MHYIIQSNLACLRRKLWSSLLKWQENLSCYCFAIFFFKKNHGDWHCEAENEATVGFRQIQYFFNKNTLGSWSLRMWKLFIILNTRKHQKKKKKKIPILHNHGNMLHTATVCTWLWTSITLNIYLYIWNIYILFNIKYTIVNVCYQTLDPVKIPQH